LCAFLTLLSSSAFCCFILGPNNLFSTIFSTDHNKCLSPPPPPSWERPGSHPFNYGWCLKVQ
jgi:hypothetical protein